MSHKLNVMIGSTRPGRVGLAVATWVKDLTTADDLSTALEPCVLVASVIDPTAEIAREGFVGDSDSLRLLQQHKRQAETSVR